MNHLPTLKDRTTKTFIDEYNYLNELFACDKNLTYMNHGYSPVDNRLVDSDVMLKQSASLYLKTTEGMINHPSKLLLEVGCGRGGGLNTLQENYPDVTMYGCDISPYNIEYSKYFNKSINYCVADAMDLPYRDNMFDYIVNIESAHCYDDKEKFYSECNRVLMPDGLFFYADITDNAEELNGLYSSLKSYFTVETFLDITDNVTESCKEMSQTLQPFSQARAYNYLHSVMQNKYEIYKNKKQHFFIMKLKVNK